MISNNAKENLSSFLLSMTFLMTITNNMIITISAIYELQSASKTLIVFDIKEQKIVADDFNFYSKKF